MDSFRRRLSQRNRHSHLTVPQKMKNQKDGVGTEEGPTERRRSSASIDEIRDLYSALQGLVPSSDASSVNVNETTGTSSLNSDDTPQSNDKQLFTLKDPKRLSEPLPSKTNSGLVEGRRNRSHSLDAALPSHSKKVIMRQDSIDVYRCKRTPTKSKESLKRLFTVVKDFDEADVDYNRGRSHSLGVLFETTSAEATEDHGICETDGKDFASTADFNNTQKHLNSAICEESSTENDRKIANDDDMDTLSGVENYVKGVFPNKKRLSAGDILERQRARICYPGTPYRRRSIGGSLLLRAIVSSASTSPKRKGSLASALTLIAHKNELQEFLKNLHKDECSGKQRIENDETGQENANPQKSMETESKDGLQEEMKNLLEAIEELQHDSTNSSIPTQRSCLDASKDARRASVGTEMQNLLSAIRELILAGEVSPTSTPSCSRPDSRRPSLAVVCPGGRKESLDELEAYFKTKLENISESHDTDRFSPAVRLSDKGTRVKCSNNREKMRPSFNRRTSAPQVERKMSLQQPALPKSNSLVDLLKPGSETEFQRQQSHPEFKGHRGKVRTRSQSVHDIRLPEIRINNKSTYSSPRTRGQQVGISRTTSADSQIDRTLWKEDQLMFADQVNKRLQDWLERATSLSLDEMEQTKEDHELQESNSSAVANSCSSDNEVEHKSKKSRFGMRKVLRKKIKRSKSIHNLSEPDQEKRSKSPIFKRAERNKVKRSKSLHNLMDEEESTPKQKTNMLRSPKSLLRIGRERLMRSKSVRNDTERPKLSTANSTVTESDESFDDGNSIVDTTCNFQNSNPNTESNNNTTEVRPKSSPLLKQSVLSKAGEKATTHCKRLSKFPAHLPLFYIPGNDVPRIKTTKDERYHLAGSDSIEGTQLHSAKKNFAKAEMKQSIFYDDASTQTVPIRASFFTISRNSSSGTDEGYIRSPSLDEFDDSSGTSPDFNDFRFRTKSTESADSGCPV